MSSNGKMNAEVIQEMWQTFLMTGGLPEFVELPWYRHKPFRGIFQHLPDNPRCRFCHTPFEGPGGTLMRLLFGVTVSRLNPQLCNQCEQFVQHFKGGAEVELSILFADVRGSTGMAEQMNPTAFSAVINRFYQAATKALFDNNAMVEKLIGDAVTGFFTPGISGKDHARKAVAAAREILRVTGHEDPNGPWVQVGIGIHTGRAYVGSVNSDAGAADISVLGDAPNVGARLAALAGPGEIYLSQPTAEAAGLSAQEMTVQRQVVKGRSEPVDICVLTCRG